MTYLERIATEPPADLIAAEAGILKDALLRRYPTQVWKHLSHAQAKQNQAKVDAALDQLRDVWRLANTGEPSWRQALIAVADQHHSDGVAAKRFRLIAEHSPERQVAA